MTRPDGNKILVVEDEEPIRILICAMLAQSGYQIVAAADGEEALAVWESQRSGIAALLTDVVMPGIRGPELARRIKEEAPGTAVIFISGYSDDPVIQDAGDIEFSFISKPFTQPELTEVVRSALENPPRR
jgi:two-component system, cell cycle sensor histidine kinase and response regulator CckA